MAEPVQQEKHVASHPAFPPDGTLQVPRSFVVPPIANPVALSEYFKRADERGKKLFATEGQHG